MTDARPGLLEFLSAQTVDDGLRAEVVPEHYGAYEGAFGGLVAALALAAARGRAPDRRPLSLDCRFIRGVRAGAVDVHTTLRRAGRTVSVVEVEVVDGSGEVAATATVGFVDPAQLRSIDDAGMVRPGASVQYAEASPFQLRRARVPVVGTLMPRVALTAAGLVATVLEVPWAEAGTAAEAACLAADMAVGPPVAAELQGTGTPHPNPDLSLRFTGDDAGPEVAGVARLERIAAGVATVRIEVFSGVELIAVGCSASLLLDATPPNVGADVAADARPDDPPPDAADPPDPPDPADPTEVLFPDGEPGPPDPT